MDKEKLYNLIKENQPNICQLAIYKGGFKVYSGEWNGYNENDTCHVMSVTKSVVSLLDKRNGYTKLYNWNCISKHGIWIFMVDY